MSDNITGKFKNVMTSTGKYMLYFKSGDTKESWIPIKTLTFSTTPIQIISTFAKSPMIAVAKSVITKFSNTRRIFLIDSLNGFVPPEIRNGSDFIEYDSRNGIFYFTPFLGEVLACYKWRLTTDGTHPTRMLSTPTINPKFRQTCSRAEQGMEFQTFINKKEFQTFCNLQGRKH